MEWVLPVQGGGGVKNHSQSWLGLKVSRKRKPTTPCQLSSQLYTKMKVWGPALPGQVSMVSPL